MYGFIGTVVSDFEYARLKIEVNLWAFSIGKGPAIGQERFWIILVAILTDYSNTNSSRVLKFFSFIFF